MTNQKTLVSCIQANSKAEFSESCLHVDERLNHIEIDTFVKKK